jgi:hypothetical protein
MAVREGPEFDNACNPSDQPDGNAEPSLRRKYIPSSRKAKISKSPA